jgi:hypothetical protein
MILKQISGIAFMHCFTFYPIKMDFRNVFPNREYSVDARPIAEGLNEMVRFKVGATNLNTSNLSVVSPNNLKCCLVQDATTASKTAALNADILMRVVVTTDRTNSRIFLQMQV